MPARPRLLINWVYYRAMLPRLGKQEGDHFMEGYPDVLSGTFAFENWPRGERR